MMRIARALFGQSAATVAGLLWACSLPIVWLPTIFWDTSLAICLLTAIFAFALEFRALMTSRKWIGLGSACAITALINPAMLPALGAIVVWLGFQQPAHRVRALVLSAVTGILVFSPWPIRNAVVFHALIPLRTTVGMELWMGNRDGAKGFVDESVFPTFNKQELHDYETMGELAYTAHKSDLARNYIATHPAAFLRLTSVRIARFWFGTGSENGSPLFALHAILTTFFGFVGLGLLVREKRVAIATLFALPLLLFPFPYYITHAEFRYRLALDTLLSILAAHALVTIYRRLDGRSKPAPADTPGALREVHG
jgi:4-amino-4-deoxy-L-arabinose transferase-like glycosyltransferase